MSEYENDMGIPRDFQKSTKTCEICCGSSYSLNRRKRDFSLIICDINGSIVTEVVLMAAMLVFIIMPVFSAVTEKYVLMEKARVIRDTVDVTNISAYNALTASELGKAAVDMSQTKILDIYREMLARNLKLDGNMDPKSDSIAEGRVEVLSLVVRSSGFPAVCPEGETITRPTVHSCIQVPVKPSLYRSIILGMLGKEHIDIVVHVDSEIPLDN
jgi:hypothetical protein